MNLTKALKLKKKLIKQSNDLFNKFQMNNSFDVSINEAPTYEPQIVYEQWKECVEQLITLKTKIHTANVSIADKIFRLGEMKSMIQNLKRVDTKSGKARVNSYSIEVSEYKAWMSQRDIDVTIAKLEELIETIQEEIEAYNAVTKI